MAEQKEVKTEREKFRKTFRILGDVLFIPFFVIVLIASILMFKAKINNEVPSLFGYSAVKILSGSMEPNYHEGQVVMVKKIDTNTLKIGDVIAFYDYMDPSVDTGDLVDNMGKQTYNLQINLGEFLGSGATEAQKKVASYSKVILHRIANISTPSNPDDENYGKLFFQTMGDANNNVADEHWIMEDYVVGILSSDNSVVGNFFSFCTSTVGIIILIIIPCVALTAILVINVINEIKKYKEDKLLEQQKIDDKTRKINEVMQNESVDKEKVLENSKNKKKEDLVKDLENKTKEQNNSLNLNHEKEKLTEKEIKETLPPKKTDTNNKLKSDKKVSDQPTNVIPKTPDKISPKINNNQQNLSTPPKK